MEKVKQKALTFDDVLLLPRYSDFIPSEASTQTKLTKNMLRKEQLLSMKSDAILVNTSRGGIINEADLYGVMMEGHLSGAAIDVFDEEPPPLDHPLIRESFHNLIITPHIAWAAVEARQRALECIAENIDAFLKDKPINVVNA